MKPVLRSPGATAAGDAAGGATHPSPSAARTGMVAGCRDRTIHGGKEAPIHLVLDMRLPVIRIPELRRPVPAWLRGAKIVPPAMKRRRKALI